MLSEDILDLNLPGNLIESIQDEDLLKAHEQALASNSITPLLKQELRYIIQSRRLTEGKDELVDTQTSPPTVNHELTPEDVEKRKKRKQQNRQAAKRFRERKKEDLDSGLQELDILQTKNTVLRAKFESLLQEKASLIDKLNDILCINVCVPEGSHPELQVTCVPQPKSPRALAPIL